MISLITVNTIVPEKDEIEEVGRLFREVVIARHEVDTWNKNYIESLKKNNDIKIAKKVLFFILLCHESPYWHCILFL